MRAQEGVHVVLNPLAVFVEEAALGDAGACAERVDVPIVEDLRRGQIAALSETTERNVHVARPSVP
jgi:hypothetical protein